MRTVNTYGTFEDTIARSSPRIQALAHQLRSLIVDVLPDVVEVPWPTQGVVGYGVGPKKQSQHFCYIAVQNDYVNLGFNYGAELPDPDQLLQGTGKLFRHMKIKREEDVTRPAVRRLLEIASRHRVVPHPTD